MERIRRRRFLQAGAAGAAALALSGRAHGAEPAGKPPFRLGLVTYNVAANWDLKTILSVCKSVGIPSVEFRTTHKHGVEPTLTKAQRKEVRSRCADAGIEVWGCGTACEFHSPDRGVVDKNIKTCKQFAELVADVGGKGVKVRPNGLPKGVPEARTLEQIGRALRTCGKIADDAGVEIWVEVHGRGTAEPARMKAMMEACGHPKVGVCWNSNPQDIRDGSVAGSFEMLSPWLRSCHVNDLWKEGRGEYPYRELFRLLREKGYDRPTLIEVGRVRPDPTTGTDWLRYYKALWEELARG